MKVNMKLLVAAVLLGALLAACAVHSTAQAAPTAEERRSRLQIAEAMFQERCKKAGEKIYRTVDDVEGVLLLKLRADKNNFSDQFALDDPYGSDSAGQTYIKTYFAEFYKRPVTPPPGWIPRLGYRYVEAIDQQDGRRYRYTGSKKVVGKMDVNAPNVKIDLARDPTFDINIYAFVLDRIPVTGPAPRYGVTYDDISTRDEREYWIAGSSLRVVDLRTNEVIAERIGYMMDRGQGSTAGERSPWLFAAYHACPSFPMAPGGNPLQVDQTRHFVMKVLKPKMDKQP